MIKPLAARPPDMPITKIAQSFSCRRLILTAATHEHIEAELKGPESLSQLLKAEVAAEWPPGQYDRGAQEFFRDRLQEGNQTALGWYLWYAVLPENASCRSVLIGAGGFLGPPDENGMVEIGFSVLRQWENQGLATEMAGGLVSWAFLHKHVTSITAHTELSNIACCKVLEKIGFVKTNKSSGLETLAFRLCRQDCVS